MKRAEEDEGKEDGEEIIEISAAQNSTASVAALNVVVDDFVWNLEFGVRALKCELDERRVKYDTSDKTSLVRLLREHRLMLIRCDALLAGNNFLNTNDFRRLIVPFIPDDALMAMRVVSKPWLAVAEEVIDEGVESGAMIVHSGEDHPWPEFDDEEEGNEFF